MTRIMNLRFAKSNQFLFTSLKTINSVVFKSLGISSKISIERFFCSTIKNEPPLIPLKAIFSVVPSVPAVTTTSPAQQCYGQSSSTEIAMKIQDLNDAIEEEESALRDYRHTAKEVKGVGNKDDQTLYNNLAFVTSKRIQDLKEERQKLIPTAATVGDIQVLINGKYLSWYLRRYEISPNYTELLCNIIHCNEMTSLPEDVTLIQLRDEVGNFKIAENFIYVRKFYPDLLAKLRSLERAILIGNPGTGKSMFFYYYLARICNPDKFGELPPDFRKRTESPEVVIYQLGNVEIIVFFVKHQLAHKFKVTDSDILLCFDPTTTVYIYEPGFSVTVPLNSYFNISTLLLVSPDDRRYKEFGKHGGIKVFMPCFTEPELLTIGRHMRDQSNFPPHLQKLYTDDSLKQRFFDFGGIIRYVCPAAEEVIIDAYKTQIRAIKNCDVHKILTTESVEDINTSHFIAKYVVATSGEHAFLSNTTTLEIVSDRVRMLLEGRLIGVSNND